MGNRLISKSTNAPKIVNEEFIKDVIRPKTYMLSCNICKLTENDYNIKKFYEFLEEVENIECDKNVYLERYPSIALCFSNLSLELYMFVIMQLHEYLDQKYWKRFIFITDNWIPGYSNQDMYIKVLALDSKSLKIGFKLLNNLSLKWEYCIRELTPENPKVKNLLYEEIIGFDPSKDSVASYLVPSKIKQERNEQVEL